MGVLEAQLAIVPKYFSKHTLDKGFLKENNDKSLKIRWIFP